MPRVLEAWNEFFFRPVSARGLGVIRIGIGLMLLWFNLDMWQYLDVLIGPDSMARAGSEQLSWSRWTWFDHIEDIRTVKGVHALSIVANVCFMVGFRSRLSGLLSVIAVVALYQRNPSFTNGGDRLVRELAIYLCLVPCGAAMSVDSAIIRWRRARQGLSTQYSSLVPVLAHRLIAIQVAVMYGVSGWDKVHTEGWQDGTALYFAMSKTTYQRAPWLVEPFTQSWLGQRFCEFGTYTTLVWELGFPLLVLWKPTRWAALVLGIGVHAGIHITLIVGLFSIVSVWGYLAYLGHDWVEVLQDRWRPSQSP